MTLMDTRSSATATADATTTADRWTFVCRYDDLLPDRGVAALVDGEQVAVFRLGNGSLHAVSNYCPGSGAYVISRGIVGSHGGAAAVTSPVYKDVFDLRTGACLSGTSESLAAHLIYQHHGLVFCALREDSSHSASPEFEGV